MISLLKNTLLRRHLLKPGFCFAVSKDNLQISERNKAILASQIIQIIKESPLNEYRSIKPLKSLKQTILDKIEAYQIQIETGRISEAEKLEITEEVRNALRKYFEEGAWVPLDMCNQTRFDEGLKKYTQIKKLNEEVEINVSAMKEEQISSLEFRKLKFCPTYFVTGQIFRHIINAPDFQLLTGQYGVGKTYSFILYAILSEIIFRYRHNYCSKRRMDDLPTSINRQIPKVLYWCINLTYGSLSAIQINNLIKRQFYELNEKPEILGFDSIFTINSSVHSQLYTHFDIKTMIFIDQISELASIIRKRSNARMELQNFKSQRENRYKGKEKSEISQKEKEEDENKYVQLLNAVLKIGQNANLFNLYQKTLQNIIMQRHFQRILYLSSVDIEKNVLGQLKLMGQSKQETILHRMKRIVYPSKFYGDVSISDSVELFMTILKNKWIKEELRSLNDYEETLLKKIKKLVYGKIKARPLTFFLPLSIKNVLIDIMTSTIYRLSQWTQDTAILNTKIQKLLDSVQEDSIGEMKTKLSEFLQKKLSDQQLEKCKPFILMQLWAETINIEEKAQQIQSIDAKNSEDISKKIFNDLPGIQIKLTNIKIQNDMEPAMLQKLFGFTGNQKTENSVTCFVSPIAIRSVINKFKKNLFNKLLASQQSIFKHIRKGSALGIFIQSVFIDILSKGSTKFEYSYSSKGNKQIISMIDIFPVIGGFIPIPKIKSKAQKDFAFLNSFVSHVNNLSNDQISTRKNRWNLLLPVKRQFEQNLGKITQNGIKDSQIDHFSKLIDFALCKYEEQQNKFGNLIINAFDVTIGEKQHIDKIDRFLQEFAKFQDKCQRHIKIDDRQIKVTLNYTVITTKSFNFNCKDHFDQRISKLQKELKNSSDENRSQTEGKLNALKEFNFSDNGRISFVNNQKFILRSVGVVSMFDDIAVDNNTENTIDLEWRMLERFKKEVKQNPYLIDSQE